MRCSRNEAVLILSKWFHASANLIWPLWITAVEEVIHLRGQISTLDLDRFVLAGSVGSVQLPFETAIFDYGEVAAASLTQKAGIETRGTPFWCKGR